MVVIACHLLVSSYQQFRNGNSTRNSTRGENSERVTRRSSADRRNMGDTDNALGIPAQIQDAILQLSGIARVEDFEESAVQAFQHALPSVVDAVLYVQRETGADLTTHRGLFHVLPKNSLAWEAVRQKRKLIETELPDIDPVAGLFCNGSTQGKTLVSCCPVLSRDTGSVVAVIVLLCDKEFSEEDGSILDFLLLQLAVCHQRLCFPITNSTSLTQNHANNVDDSAILKLCAELYDQDATALQLKVIKYLKDHTDAQSGFLLLRPLGNKELLCQVLGEKVLKEEKPFRGNLELYNVTALVLQYLDIDGTCFGKTVNKNQPTTLDDMDKVEQVQMEATLGYKLKSLLCIPINISGNVVGLACLTNKHGAQRFSDQDIEVVHHCFKYTAAVLRSTLAVQNERRLKNETQALLQVTKNLFTHLGEYSSALMLLVSDSDLWQRYVSLARGNSSYEYCLPKSQYSLGELQHFQTQGPADTERKIPKKESSAVHIDSMLGPTSAKLDASNKDSLKVKFPSPEKTIHHSCMKSPSNDKTASVSIAPVKVVDQNISQVYHSSGVLCSSTNAINYLKETNEDDDRDSASCSSKLATPKKEDTCNIGAKRLPNKKTSPDCDGCEEKHSKDTEHPQLLPRLAICTSFQPTTSSTREDPVTDNCGCAVESYGVLNKAFFASSSSNQSSGETNAKELPSSCGSASNDNTNEVYVSTGSKLNKTNDLMQNRKDLGQGLNSSCLTCRDSTQFPTQVAKAPQISDFNDDLTVLLREIMQEARNLTKAERCSVFLLEELSGDLVAKVFDGDIPLLPNSRTVEEGHREVRISSTQGIAGNVATTGQLINTDDAYSHPLFFRGMDEATGFRTRNILCFPIKNEKDQVVGVAQLCNKLSGSGFSKFDEEIAVAFSVYCCIAISHSLLYKKVHDARIRSKLSNELMIFHMQVAPEDVEVLKEKEIPPAQHFHADMARICFTPRSIRYDDTPLAVLSMLEDMNFLSTFRVHKESFAKFILMVRKGYRDPPYHNWSHAFSVAHFCYIAYKNLNLSNYLSDIEVFSLFIACLCHDIDHRGTTNSYQVQSDSILASLYSSEGSVMERHHFAQSMCILNTEGCNIFENLSSSEYHKVLDLMRDIILATDLAHHLRIMPDLENMIKEGYQKNKPEHKMLLLCMLMTCCDLSDQTKNWANTKKIAELVYREFFSQGDLEKALGHRPLEMMDRERAHIPQLQIDFLESIVLPLFKLLGGIFPVAKGIVAGVEDNRRMWVRINTKTQKMRRIGGSSLEIFEMDLESDLPS